MSADGTDATGLLSPPQAGPDGSHAITADSQWATAEDGSRLAFRTWPGAGLAIINPLGYGVTLEGLDGAPGQRQFLHAMAAGSYLAAYDQGGAGASAAAGAPVDWDARAADLWRVAEWAGVERAVLYGVADAGYTVLHAAVQQPDRVLGIVLNFVPPSFHADSPSEGVPRDLTGRWFAAEMTPAEKVLAMMSDLGIAETDARSLASAWGQAAAEPALSRTEALIATADIRPLMHRVTQPALVIEPQRRALFGGWGSALASLLPHATVVRPARGVETIGSIHGFLSVLSANLGRRASQLSPALSQAVLRGEQSMRELRRIAVAVDDDVASARAVELACRLGEAQRSEITLIHVVPVPYTLPLQDPPHELARRGERALSLGEAIVQRNGLPPPRRRLVCGRTVAGSILATMDEVGADLVVVANRGTAGRSGGMSDVVEELVRRAPAKVVVDRGT